MAYDSTQLSRLDSQYDGSISLWAYRSEDDLAAVAAAGYITDARPRYMRKGDAVFVVTFDTQLAGIFFVTDIDSVTGAGTLTQLTGGAGGGALIDLSNVTLPIARTNIGLGTGNSPSFTGLGLRGGDASAAWGIYIGPVTTSTPDPVLVFGRAITGSGNAHGITDASTFTSSAGSYNSFDARPTILQAGAGGHFAGFQPRAIVDVGIGNTLDNYIGVNISPVVNSGTVSFMYGILAHSPNIAGSGHINRLYGLYVEDSSAVADLAWGVHVVADMSYFGGNVGIGLPQPSSRLHFASIQTDVPTMTDDAQTIVTGSLNIVNWTPPKVTLNASSGNLQYLLIRPVIAPTQNTAHNLYGLNTGLTLGFASEAFNFTGDVTSQSTQLTFSAGYTGTVSKVFGHRFVDLGAGARTVTTQTAINIQALSGAANNTSLLIGGNNAVAGNWGIYNSSTYDNALFGRVGIGGVPAASLHILGALTQAAWLTAGVGFRISNATYTDSTSSGTVTEAAAHNIGSPTFAASSSTTYTTAETFRINGPPTAGTNVTISNQLALRIAAGNARFDGFIGIGASPTAQLSFSAGLTAAAWTTNGIGIRINAQTYTDSSSTGVVAEQAVNSILAPTVAASSSTTYTISSTLRVAAAPTAGTNVTQTNAYSIYAPAGAARFDGGIVTGSTTLHTTTVALNDGAAAALGTLSNAPAAGNPTKWVPINDNGTTRYVPAW